MQKGFDSWNEQKKKIDALSTVTRYAAREVWWVALGTNVGFEQDGDGDKKQRPVLILKGFSKEVCIVIPLTTSPKKNKYRIDAGIIGGESATALISQIRLIDTKRLLRKVQTLDVVLFEVIRKEVKDML
jgi:mRNA interferase MazF